jgi:hypothetical protein
MPRSRPRRYVQTSAKGKDAGSKELSDPPLQTRGKFAGKMPALQEQRGG